MCFLIVPELCEGNNNVLVSCKFNEEEEIKSYLGSTLDVAHFSPNLSMGFKPTSSNVTSSNATSSNKMHECVTLSKS